MKNGAQINILHNCPQVLGSVEDSFFSSTGEEERRKGVQRGFVFPFRSKESSSRMNIHVATEDLSFSITLKRVKTQRVRETGRRRRNLAF